MENKFELSLNEIYRHGKHGHDSYLCEDFIIYPEGKEKHGGFVFGLIELRATPIKHAELITRTIINSLKDEYYNQINASPDPNKLNLEAVFEHALQKTNTSITELLEIGQASLTLKNLNYVIAVAKQENDDSASIYLTQHGSTFAYLLHPNKERKYKPFNIIEKDVKTESDLHDEIKIFSSTLAGSIGKKDVFYLATENFNTFISANKVADSLNNFTLQEAQEHLKHLVKKTDHDSYMTHASIFLNLKEKSLASAEAVSKESIDRLITTKQATEKFLSNGFSFNIKSYTKSITEFFNKTARKIGFNLKNRKSSPNDGNALIKQGKSVIRFVQVIVTKAPAMLKSGFSQAGRHVNKKNLNKTLRASGTAIKKSRDKVKSLHRVNIGILIGILVVVVLFILGIFWVQKHNEEKQVAEAYQNEITSIDQMIGNAEVKLIQKDEPGSLKLLKQAEEKIKYLPQATEEQQANFERLNQLAGNLQNKLLRIKKVTPRLITEIKANEQKVTPISVGKTENEILMSYGEDAVISYDLEGKTLSAPLPGNHGEIVHTASDEDSAVYITAARDALLYNKANNSLDKKSINWGNLGITNIALFNDNLYALDSEQEMIFKYANTGSGWSGQQFWLKNKGTANLSQTVDLAIDGNIYVLTTDGKAYKFFSGKQEEFALNQIEPPLKNANAIYTQNEEDNLYVLEGSSKRLVEFDKFGRFIGQYQFDSLTTPIQDGILGGNTFYFTSGEKLYSAKLE